MRYDAITLGETDLLFGMAYLKDLISKFDLPVVSVNVGTKNHIGVDQGSEAGGATGSEGDVPPRAEGADSEGSAGSGAGPTVEASPGGEADYTAGAAAASTAVPSLRGASENVAADREGAGRTGFWSDVETPLGEGAEAEIEEQFLDFPPYIVKKVGGVRVAVVGALNHRVTLPESVADTVSIGHMEKALIRLLPRIRKEADIIVALAHCGSTERARVLAAAFDDLDVIVAGHVGPAWYKAERLNHAAVVYVRDHGRYIGRLDLMLDENKDVIGFDQETVPVAPSIPDDPNVVGLLSEYIDRLKILVSSPTFRPKSADLKAPAASYLTTYGCIDCHPKQTEQWNNTSHAHAFESIVERGRDFDPDCQKCHTTGFRYRGGFLTPRGTPQFKDVGCEACHGPGGDHRHDPTAHYGEITEVVCLACHTPHNSPDFDYERYLKKVTH